MAATMVLGTGANSSKTLLSVALLRLLVRKGAGAQPYKALVVIRDKDEARCRAAGSGLPYHLLAAGVEADPSHCPAVVHQTGWTTGRLERADGRSIDVPVPCSDTVDLGALPAEIRRDLAGAARAAADRMAAAAEHLVVEGAGNPTVLPPDLDLPNVAVARWLRPSIVLVSQFSHGAAASSIIGTYQCLPDDVRSLVRGFVLANTPASTVVERSARLVTQTCGLPALGVLPSRDDLAYDELFSDDAMDGWADALEREADVHTLLGAG
jgi:adenosylcobyric acid synthase